MRLKLCDLMPSQFLIDAKLLEDLLGDFNIEKMDPVPVKEIDGVFMITDGHHRVCALDLKGFTEAPICEETDDLDWEAYRQNMKDCNQRGVFSALDLKDHIVTTEEFHLIWDGYCDALHRLLEAKYHSVSDND